MGPQQDTRKTGEPGPGTIVDPRRTLEKRKAGTWDPNGTLAGPSYKNRKTGTRDLRKNRKRGPQWDPQKT